MKSINKFALVAALLAALATVGGFGLARAIADEAHDHGAASDTQATADKTAEASATGAAYPLDFCAVTGDKLGDTQVLYDYEGREIRFCCNDCIADFEAEPAKYIAKIDEAIIAQQLPHYALTTCPISGEELGGMGEPVDYVYDNRLVRFCCSGCIKGFEKNPEKSMAEVDAAIIAAETEDYPLTTCPVSGAELSDGAVDVVVAGRLFKLCCMGCLADIEADPAKYSAMLDEAK